MKKRGHIPMYSGIEKEKRPVSQTYLATWLKVRGLSIFAFARAVGADASNVRAWANGQQLPSLIYAFKIERETQGGVLVSSWLGTELGKRKWAALGVDYTKLETQRENARKRHRGDTE